MHDVAVLVGSLRRDSLNLKLARALAKLGKGRFNFNFAELGDLPIYNQDMEADLPAKYIENGQFTLILEDPAASWTTASDRVISSSIQSSS